VLDLTLWLMGNPRPTSVMGSAYTIFGPNEAAKCGGTYDVEDLAAGLIKLDNGATLFLEASWASHIAQDVIYTNLIGTINAIQVALPHFRLQVATQAAVAHE
jgi:predicted dehydrogenase